MVICGYKRLASLSVICLTVAFGACSRDAEYYTTPSVGQISTPAPQAADAKNEVKAEWQDFIAALENYTAAEKAQALDLIEAEMRDVDARIDALESDLAQASETAEQQWRDSTQEALETLKQQKSELDHWVGKVQTSSADAWHEAREGFSEAYEVVEKSLQEAEKAFDEVDEQGGAQQKS